MDKATPTAAGDRDRGAGSGRGGRGPGVQPRVRRDAGRPGHRRGDRAPDRTTVRRRQSVSSGTRLVADAVLPCDGSGAVYRPGAVDVGPDGRIVNVGPVAAPAESTSDGAEWTVRWVGGLLMPGLVNAHAHGPMTLLRGQGEGLPLDRWLREVIWPREARVGAEDVFWGMTPGRGRAAALRRDHVGGDVLPRRPAGPGRGRGRQPVPADARDRGRAGLGAVRQLGRPDRLDAAACARCTRTIRGSRSASARTRRTCCRTRRSLRSARRPGRPVRR